MSELADILDVDSHYGLSGHLRINPRKSKARRHDEFVPEAQSSPKQARARLRQLAAQQSSVQEQEQQRIAAELHNRIGKTLNVLKSGIDDTLRALGDDAFDEAEELLRLLSGKVEGAIDEVRQVTVELHALRG